MNLNKLRSHAKINLSLGVIKKLHSKLHKIESIVSFIDLYDEIQFLQYHFFPKTTLMHQM